MTATSDAGPPVPAVPVWFQSGFHRFLLPYLRRHFHAIGINRQLWQDWTPNQPGPLLVYANHPSWWDPLIAHFINRVLFPGRQFYAPIDATALEQYRVFGKLGFYGVKLNSASGAAAFLKSSQAILNAPQTALWMTPEGRFADPRDQSGELMPGLAHLCSRQQQGWVLPLALEYVFWDERLPVCLARFATPISLSEQAGRSKSDWNTRLTDSLRENQQVLAEMAIARKSAPFENVLRGARGIGGIYDTFRRGRAWITGKPFRMQHGDQF